MDQKQINKINKMYKDAIQEMNAGEFEKALTIANQLKNLGDHFYISSLTSALLINLGPILGKDVLEEGVNLLEKDREEMVNSGAAPQNIYYNLANGYYGLFTLKTRENPYYSFFQKTELDKSIEYYRKALKHGLNSSEVYVNLGNCFSSNGRSVDALDYYEKALELDPNHAMALGNQGIALYNYVKVAREHQATFLLESYSLLSRSLELSVPAEAVETFSTHIDKIKTILPNEKDLDTPPEFPGYKIEAKSDFEEYLVKFCLENKLYLNICNFCQKCDACIGDTIRIIQMTVPIGEVKDYPQDDPFLRLSSYLNQIKQDYVTARFLLVLSRYEKLNLSFVDKRVKMVDTLDYNMYNVYIQLLQFAFKNSYDVLDKIAYFMNDYLKLGLGEMQIDFRKVWYKKGNVKKAIIHENIRNSKNLSLNALFKIHQDLEGPHKKLKDIRNAITHRFIKIKMFENLCVSEKYEVMTEDTLFEHTLELTKMVRNAVIYLLYFVNLEEQRRSANMDGVPVGKLTADDIPDDLKSLR